MNNTIYNSGTFKDYKGIERPFTMAAHIEKYQGFTEIAIGIAVCNEKDLEIAKEETARKIAKGKSFMQNNTHSLVIGEGIAISSAFVKHLLINESKRFIKNPGCYIANYNKDEEHYRKELEFKGYVDSMDEKVKDTYETLKKMPEEELNKLMESLAYDKNNY